jgi:hypothetical protein
MFGQSRPVVIDRYASRRSRRRLPKWLLWLLAGATLGAAGVLYVQQQHLPARLSAAESGRLQSAYTSADAERTRLAAELAQTRATLDETLAAQRRAATELATAQREPNALRGQIESLLDALPPDPRGGAVQVRAARFDAAGDGKLDYNLVLSRAQVGGAAFSGVLQFAVTGKTARGSETTATLEPVSVNVGRYQITSGTLALPAGLAPRQVTVRVLDRPDGRLMGMRVLNVR